MEDLLAFLIRYHQTDLALEVAARMPPEGVDPVLLQAVAEMREAVARQNEPLPSEREPWGTVQVAGAVGTLVLAWALLLVLGAFYP
jgi:hypothetical protein